MALAMKASKTAASTGTPAMKKANSKTKAAMKAVMKAKRVTKVARGRLAKALVFRGSKEKTVGGVRKDGLMKNVRGRIVSKKASAAGKLRFKNIESWVDSVSEARKALHISGFVAVNGKSLQGKALYSKTKSIYEGRRGSATSQSAASASTAVATAAAPARVAEATV